MKSIALVYMAGGVSSRFGGKIKQLAKIGPNGETLIEYSLNQAFRAGFEKIIIVVGEKTAKPIKELVGNNYNGVKVYYALQEYDTKERDKPWGTVDALCSAKELIDCPFVVCNGDDIYGEKAFKMLVKHLKTENENATIFYKLMDAIPKIGLTNRGIFKIGENGYVQAIKEVFNIDKNNLSAAGVKADDFCNQNIFAFHPNIIKMLDSILKDFKEKNRGDRKKECLLPTEVSGLLEYKKIKIKAYPAKEKWLGVTNPEDEEIIKNELLKIIEN